MFQWNEKKGWSSSLACVCDRMRAMLTILVNRMQQVGVIRRDAMREIPALDNET